MTKLYATKRDGYSNYACVNSVRPYTINDTGFLETFAVLEWKTNSMVNLASMPGIDVPVWPWYTVLELKECE